MHKVLVVAVHPDDETLGCGGTILKHREAGDEINWMIITSINNHPLGFWGDEMVAHRDNIVKRVAEAYGFNNVVDMGYPTIMLDNIDLGKLVSDIGKTLEDIKPDTIYLMYQNDVHSDHRIAFQAVYSTLKSFRRPFIRRILMMETLSETEFAVATPPTSFIPNVFVDISDYIEKKLEIMKIYDTEVMESPYPRSLSSIEALARYRGSRAGVMYAEAFMLLYERL